MSSLDRRVLGGTGLLVSPVGIGGGASITDRALLAAFDRGINYFFYSSDLHHFAYSQSADAIRTLCRRGSAVRDKVVLSTVTYVNDPRKLHGVIYDQFRELRLEYIDILNWGWVLESTDIESLLDASRLLTGNTRECRMMKWMLGWRHLAEDLAGDLQRRGLVRFCGASFHSRRMATRAIAHGIDVAMVRYNVAHRGMETDIQPYLAAHGGVKPGIVAFNTSHEGVRPFHKPPRTAQPPRRVPTIMDSYRFALSNPIVDVVLTAPKDEGELDAAVAAATAGPLPEDDLAFMHGYGEWWRHHVSAFGTATTAHSNQAVALTATARARNSARAPRKSSAS